MTPGVSRSRILLAAGAIALGLGSVTGAALQAAYTEKRPAAAPIDVAKAKVSAENTAGFPEVKGGDFTLVDHHGDVRTSRNPDGHFQLVFFGYAQCKAICTAALPTMAAAVDILDASGLSVTPLLITVDPERDTVAALREAAPAIHPDMVGLTGPEEALAAAYKAFNVQKKFLFDHLEEGPIYTHGSFIYLLDGDGSFQTLFPPIMSAKQIATVTAGYVNAAKAVN